MQAILASQGDAPYRKTGGNDTSYMLMTVSWDDTGPILHMRRVANNPEQIEMSKPETT